MSWSSRVRVNGKKVVVIYAAAQLPISTRVGAWQKSREVRRHLARTHTKYCFVAAKSGEGVEVWWSAEERGVSIAASLDNWYAMNLEEDGETADDFVAIIAFDTSVYLAEVVDGLVKTERIVDENSAPQHLDRYRAENRVMHGFMAGNHSGPVAQYVELVPLPFNLSGNRFERSVVVFLRNRLYHPTYMAPVLILFTIAALGQIDWGRLQDRVMNRARVDANERQEPAVPTVSHAGGAMLRELVRFMWRLDVLYGDGLQRLEFTYPSSVVLGGQSLEYLSQAKDFADRHHGQLRWNSAGWAIAMEIPMPDAMQKIPVPTSVLLENMSRGWPALDLVEGSVNGYTSVTSFNIDQTGINTFDLIDIAQRLDGYPAVISRLSCSYADYRLSDCELSIETRTL